MLEKNSENSTFLSRLSMIGKEDIDSKGKKAWSEKDLLLNHIQTA